MFRSRPPAAILLPGLLLWACAGKGSGTDSGTDEDDDGGVTAGDGGTESCGDVAPVITAGPFCSYDGLDAAEPGQPEVPVIRISASVHDDDGDLHYRATRLWIDGAPLGEVDYETATLKERSLTYSSDRACEEIDVDGVGDKVYLPAPTWLYGVEYDWALSISDAEGNWSEPALVTCKTPLEDGSEP